MFIAEPIDFLWIGNIISQELNDNLVLILYCFVLGLVTDDMKLPDKMLCRT